MPADRGEARIDDATVDYYARRAAEYESVYEKPERRADLVGLKRRLRSEFAERRVLELACGTGYWTVRISERARSVVATDINEEVLEVARAKDWRGRDVSFEVADAFSPETTEGEFDAAFAGFLWSHIKRKDPGAFLGGLHRRLQPGAVVILIDNRFVPGSSTPINRTDELGNTYQMRSLADGSRHEVLKNFPDESELLDVVSRMAPSVVDASVDLLTYFWLLRYRTRS